MSEYLGARDLWRMTPDQFNEWRAQNDLPVLFSYFHSVLPDFDHWLKSIDISVEEIYRVLNIGGMFRGEREKMIVREIDSNGIDKCFCIDKAEYGGQRWRDIKMELYERSVIPRSTFLPYFLWIKIRSGKNLPVMWDTVNKSYTDNFFFGGYRNIHPNSRGHIWRGPELLKLGGLSLERGVVLAGRNLDFVDLDSLNISGDVYASGYNDISYTSMRYLVVKDTRQAFFRFYNCKFEDSVFINSSVQDFYFFDCDMRKFSAEGSTLFRLSFIRSKVLPFFERCDLKSSIDYRPAKDDVFAEESYRLLKNAYNAVGQKKFAAEYFYFEQITHRRNIFNATHFYKFRDQFPNGYPGTWLSVLKAATHKSLKEIVRKKISYHLEFILKPKYFARYLDYKLQWLYSLFDWALWGYGVKLHRIVFSSLFFILIYAVIYNVFEGQIKSAGEMTSFFDYVYFSMVTFTTLGYGDVFPQTTLLRVICGTEAFLGVFMIGLIIAGFSRRAD